MALEDDIRILSRVSLLEGFSREQLRLLAFGTEVLKLSPGRELFYEGAPADCAFVIVTGQIELYRERQGKRESLRMLGAGSMLGEFALIAAGRRLTGARAAVETELLRLTRTQFHRILEEYPDMAVALQQRVAENLTAMLDDITRLSDRFGE
jgi:CRP-like cAMP-binding protein